MYANASSALLEQAALRYRAQFGWDVKVEASRVWLRLSREMVAISAPGEWRASLLRGRQDLGLSGPVLLTRATSLRLTFFADGNGSVFSRADLPEDVILWQAPACVPIAPSFSSNMFTEWVVKPRPGDHWLPLASNVLDVVRSVSGLAVHDVGARRGRSGPRK
jgi:hypothetical protein